MDCDKKLNFQYSTQSWIQEIQHFHMSSWVVRHYKTYETTSRLAHKWQWTLDSKQFVTEYTETLQFSISSYKVI